jgi:hypothetical protein
VATNPYYRTLVMALDPGYDVIDCGTPGEELIHAARAEIAEDKLCEFQRSSSTRGLEQLGWGEKCDELFNYGLDVSKIVYVPRNITYVVSAISQYDS